MDQQQVNNAEWEDERNWSGPVWLGVYFSKRDARTLVPKRIPSLGWTINVGRPGGVYLLVGTIVGIPLLVILATVL